MDKIITYTEENHFFSIKPFKHGMKTHRNLKKESMEEETGSKEEKRIQTNFSPI